MKSAQKKRWFERHPGLSFTVLIIMGILLIDFISARTFIPEDFNSFRISSPYYHHDLVPNRHERNIWGNRVFDVYTNSLGFKDKSCRLILPKTDKKRILFMGDSFTESMGMTWKESFPGILGSRFTEMEILNAGVVSYSPKLYYLKVKFLIENAGINFDELFVLIDNSDPLNEITYQDFEPYSNNSLKKFGFKANHFFFNYSYLYHSIANLIIKSRTSQVTSSWNPVSGPSLLDEFSKEEENFIAATVYWSYTPQIFEKWGKPGLALAAENMQKLSELCKEHNIKVSVIIYPWPAMIMNKDLQNVQVGFWENFCHQNSLQFINLYPAFISREDPAEIIKKYFIEGDVHWNQEGNRFVADQLQNYVSL
jgi:hypothetical protein